MKAITVLVRRRWNECTKRMRVEQQYWPLNTISYKKELGMLEEGADSKFGAENVQGKLRKTFL